MLMIKGFLGVVFPDTPAAEVGSAGCEDGVRARCSSAPPVAGKFPQPAKPGFAHYSRISTGGLQKYAPGGDRSMETNRSFLTIFHVGDMHRGSRAVVKPIAPHTKLQSSIR